MLAFVLSWAVLCAPWLGGELTIPYDAKAHFQAQLQFLANALHSGQSPFWAPNVFTGSPQIADPQSLIFSPAILLAYLSAEPSFTMVDGYVFGLLGCGGIAILMFFRDRGWHPAGALVAALAFAFGASAAWRIQHIGQIQSYALLPIALWLLARAMQHRSALWGVAAGACIGLMVVEPNQVALLSVYVLAGYVASEIVARRPLLSELRRQLAPVGAAAGAALLVASVPVLLTYLFVEQSSRSMVGFAEAARGSLHPASLLTAVIGDLFGALSPEVAYWGPHSAAWDPSNLTLSQNMSQLYVGAVPVLLLLTVGIMRGVAWSAEIRFFSVALGLLTVFALGEHTPLFYLTYEFVPGIDLFRRPADATFLMGALAALVGGYLVHRLMLGTIPAVSARRRFAEGGAVVGLLVAGFVLAVRMGHARDAMQPTLTAIACLAAAAGLLAVAQRHGARHALACLAAIGALMTLDLRLNNGPNESTALAAANYDLLKPDCKNETVRLLKALTDEPLPSPRRDRVELVGLGFEWPNLGLIHGFDHSLGYNPLRLEAASEGIGAGDTIAGWDQRRFTPLFPSYRSMLADMMGLRYIASSVPIEQVDKKLKPGDLVQIARTKDAYVYENPGAMPRVLFVGHWQLADFERLMRTGAWPTFDPSKTLLLESPPEEGPMVASIAAADPFGFATVAHYENTVIVVDVTASHAGFVLMNSAWHPWWRATVDGKDAAVLKANVMFRAVQVPAGSHRIRLTFEPLAGAVNDVAEPLLRPDRLNRRKAESRVPNL